MADETNDEQYSVTNACDPKITLSWNIHVIFVCTHHAVGTSTKSFLCCLIPLDPIPAYTGMKATSLDFLFIPSQ